MPKERNSLNVKSTTLAARMVEVDEVDGEEDDGTHMVEEEAEEGVRIGGEEVTTVNALSVTSRSTATETSSSACIKAMYSVNHVSFSHESSECERKFI